MRVTQKMMQNPNVQADMQKAKKAGEALAKGSPRYQVWYPDRKTPATGTVSMEVQKDERFKTAVDEQHTCRETAEVTLEELMHGAAWPVTIKIDAQTGISASYFSLLLRKVRISRHVSPGLSGTPKPDRHHCDVVGLLRPATEGPYAAHHL